MKKYLLSWMSIVIMAFLCAGFVSCGGDDDDVNNSELVQYIGTWNCTSPATYRTSTIVTEGASLLITSSGNMTWTMSDGSKYNATMRALGDDWADITYSGKTYRAEIYIRGNYLTINVNGFTELLVKDFPFDGTYEKVK